MNRSQKGMALVIVLLIMAIMTAMVVEFASATYTANAALYNWKDAQNLSFAAKSGINLAVKVASDNYERYSYTYPGTVVVPVPNVLENFEGKVIVKVEDENAKLNLNSLVLPNGTLNKGAYGSFKKLLMNLELDEQIADKVADWINRNRKTTLSPLETRAKNAYLNSVDELWLIADSKVCEKLVPFITVYGIGGVYANIININTASVPVLIALDDMMTSTLAERIVNYRSIEPFKSTSDIVKVAGFEGPLGQSLIGKIGVKASNFRVTSEASRDRLKRIIECVIENSGGGFIVKYWQET
ncbi:MAG TPA: type II secretion system minor pseudopilin GspK [Syntrophales bacterium]|nr:type II secretion system minor pseudopilin GspK [Syntrophales bacterium]